MLRILLILLILTTNVFAVPSNQINVPNSFSANTVISSSATNSNNNEIQTKFNTHTHTDLTQVGTITTGTWAASPIAYQYITLTGSVVNADISNSAAISTTKINFGSLHQGDIFYDNGTTTITRLTPGTSGQILTTGGAGANPSWSNPSWGTPSTGLISGTTYGPATIDGVLIVANTGNGGGTNTIEIRSDASNPPTTSKIIVTNANNTGCYVNYPIKTGNYYRFISTNGTVTTAEFWPL